MSWKQKTPLLLLASVVLLGSVLAILPRLNKKAASTPTAQQPTADLIAQNIPQQPQQQTANATETKAEDAPNVAAIPATAAPEASAKGARLARAKAALREAVAKESTTEEVATKEAAAAEAFEPKMSSKRLETLKAQEGAVGERGDTRARGTTSTGGTKEFVLRHDEQEIHVKKRMRKPGARFDKPAEAMKRYLKRRLPAGEKELPIDRYYTALAQIQEMPQYSTALGKTVSRKAADRIGKSPATGKAAAGSKAVKGGQDVQPNLVGDQQAGVLGSWTNLGPGNVGGRTRALIINPVDANIMYAAGVAGGIWKSVNAGATWTPLDDFMPNIAVTTMAFDPDNPDIIWAGTGEGYFNGDAVRGAGIFRTTNAGANWFRLPATNNDNFHFVQKLVVSPANSNNIYAATRTGVMRSIDNGASWTRVISSTAAGCTGACVNSNTFGGGMDLVMRTDQATDYIFASVGTGFDTTFPQARIYRNTDAGGVGVWTEVYTETNMARTSLAIAPSNQSVIYALASSKQSGNYNTGLLAVIRSTTNGDAASWSDRVRNTSANKQDTLLLSNPIIAALVECEFDTGNQFINQGWYDNQIAVDPANSDIVWSAGIDLFRSDNGGQNWGVASYWWFSSDGVPPANADTPEYAHADNHVFAFKPGYNGTTNQTMYVGNDGGMFRTDNARTGNVGLQTGAITPDSPICGNPVAGAVQWEAINNGYQVSQFYHGMPYPNGSAYLGGFQDNGTNRGTDATGPNAWEEILGGDGGYVAVDFTNTNILYAENTGLSFQKSTDGGANFVTMINGITGDDFSFTTPFYMDTTNSQRLYIGGFYVWRTVNGAASWQRTGGFTPGDGYANTIATAPSNPNALIVGMDDGWIGRLNGLATTSGSTTTWLSSQPRTGVVSWVTFDPTNANIAYATYSNFNAAGSVGHIWKSTNGGSTWSLIDGAGVKAFPDIPAHVIVVDPTNTQRLYVGSDLGVFVSLDGGASWNKEVTGFANVQTESMAIATSGGKSSLFAFTHGRSAYRVTLSASCVQSVLPTNPPSFNKDGGTGTITVTSAVPTCDWTSTTNNGFIQINTGRTGTATGTVTYTVAPNATTAARTGSINVAGTVITITQDAQPAASASITGQVVDGTGQPAAAATVNLTGTTAAATVTNSAGGYSFNGLTPGGNYTVTVAKPGLTFGTPSKTIDNLQGIGVANFAGYVTPPVVPAEQGRLMISEFRLRGVSSADDEFIEFYNNSDSPLTITTTDGSEGWAVTGSDGNLRFIIPVNQTIPARGHYLAINTAGYTLSNYGGVGAAAGDATYTAGFPDDSGITLFTTARPANYSESTRMDAVGFRSEANVLAREGVGLAPLAAVGGQYSWVRRLATGTPQDTGSSAADFVLVSTNGGVINGVQSVLGSPGPENVLSSVNRTAVVKAQLIDPQCTGFGSPTSACQRVRTANGANPTNAAFGTLLIRRRFTNTTAQPVSRVRFRVVDITTLGNVAAGEADLRVLDSTGGTLTRVDTTTVSLTPLALETNPAQPVGGGLNSTLNLATPLASGAFIDIEFKLGVMSNGAFRFFIIVEALP